MNHENFLIPMERAMSQIRGFQGWVIGACTFSLRERHIPRHLAPKANLSLYEPVFQGQLLKKGNSLATLKVDDQNKVCADWLEAILVKSTGKISKNTPGIKSAEPSISSLVFTRYQTDEFLEQVQDDNPIHQGENAIVPGFLMANRLLSLLTGNEPVLAKIRFLAPLPVNMPAFLGQEPATDEDITRHFFLAAENHIILKAEISSEKGVSIDE